MRRLVLTLAAALLLPAGAAHAACGGQVGVRFGDSLGHIAERCGINVERLKQANPGLDEQTLQNGTFIAVPPPALPSPRATKPGNRGISGARQPYGSPAGKSFRFN